MSTPVSIPEKTSRDATDLLIVTTQAGDSYKIKNENFVQNLPTQENPFDIGSLAEISSLADGDFFPLRDASDGQDKKISKANLESEIGGGGGGGDIPYIRLEDQKSSGTSGGSFLSGARRTRDLTTIVEDSDSLCTLTDNQFCLPAGTWRIRCVPTCFHTVGDNRAWLYNISTESDMLVSNTASGADIRAEIAGRFVLTGSTWLEIQHQCDTDRTAYGFGIAGGYDVEIYCRVELWKEG